MAHRFCVVRRIWKIAVMFEIAKTIRLATMVVHSSGVPAGV
jgi:hypothetical protein